MVVLAQQLIYRSDEWEIDLARRELRVGGSPIPIGIRAFELLEVLVQSTGELVTKDDLMVRVWPGAMVDENRLQVLISTIRKALGPRRGMLKTVSGRGYRLTGNWTVRGRSPDAEPDPIDHLPQRPEHMPVSNLPLATSAMVGRSVAMVELRALLSACRLVTLTGPGGIGKTKLAIEVASGLRANDIRLVELAPLADPGLLSPTVLRGLGVGPGGGRICPESVARAIGDRPLVLILDNCEHVIDAVAEFAETVLSLCQRTTILTTSREVLRIDGEQIYRVPPLDVPPRSFEEADQVLAYSSVQLLIARTKALNSEFTPSESDLPAIAAICKRLDGIPLAIELAAARVATLGAGEVASRLDDCFGLLTGGRRTALARHQTLRATLDWSYDLLSDAERRLLRRLAIFATGFTLEAAMAVADGSEVDQSSVLDGIAGLTAKSLVTLDPSDAANRWRLLETTKIYALEKLIECGEKASVERRHAEFFRDLFMVNKTASRVEPTSKGMASRVRELDNVRAALDWAFGPEGDPAIAIALTTAYVPVWLHLSLMGECRRRAEQALDRLETATGLDARLKMEAHIVLAMAECKPIAEKAEKMLSEALQIAEGLDDTELQLRGLWAMWSYRNYRGEQRKARLVAQRFLSIAQHSGDAADALVGDRITAATMYYEGAQTEARHHLERVLAFYVAPQNERHTLWFQHDQRIIARAMLARVLCVQGFLDQAREAARTSQEDARAANHLLSLRFVLGWTTCPIALMTGDLAAAEQSLKLFAELSSQHQVAFWAAMIARLKAALLIKQGEFQAGSELIRAMLEVPARPGGKMRSPTLLADLAKALLGLRRFAEARDVVNDALELADRSGEQWYVAELLRIRGEALRRLDGRSVSAAEDAFLEAIDVAGRQEALLFEMRAARSLAYLKVRQGRYGEAEKGLAQVYERFTEGFDCQDLLAAKDLLDTLRSHE